jgi:hypothetical protein
MDIEKSPQESQGVEGSQRESQTHYETQITPTEQETLIK